MTLTEVVISNAYEIAALIAGRERKGPQADAEVLAENKGLHEQGPKVPESEKRRSHGWCRSTDRCPR
jgi:hypothetical protein